MATLPEGVGVEDVREHAQNLTLIAKGVNLYGKYMDAPEGSAAEAEAEAAVDAHAEAIVSMGPNTAVSCILALTAVLSETAEESKVQAWFDHHGRMIKEALG